MTAIHRWPRSPVTRELFIATAVIVGALTSTIARNAVAARRARGDLARLAEVQAALRRISLLIAKGEPPERVFAAVTTEMLRHFGEGGTVRLLRYELDGTVTLLAHEGTRPAGASNATCTTASSKACSPSPCGCARRRRTRPGAARRTTSWREWSPNSWPSSTSSGNCRTASTPPSCPAPACYPP